MNFKPAFILLISLFLVLAVGCQRESHKTSDNDVSSTGNTKYSSPKTKDIYNPETRVPDLGLDIHISEENNAVVEAEVMFNHNPDKEQPRMVELILQHSSNLEYYSSTAGDATVEAGKTLVVQKRSNNKLRLIVFSNANLNRLNSGKIATLQFRVLESGTAELKMLNDGPVFAPPQAQGVILIGEPVQLNLGDPHGN